MTAEDSPPPSAIDRIRNDPALRTRDDTGVWAIGLGVIAWLIAAALVTFYTDAIAGSTEETSRWIQICLTGAGLGVLGFIVVWRRHRRIRSDQDLARRE